MSKQPFRYLTWEVVEVPGAWRVRNARTGRVFQVLVDRVGRRRKIGACSCGARPGNNPADYCRHQRAAFELLDKQWLERNFGRGAYELQQERIRLVAALSFKSRAGYLECPHCLAKITAHDLQPDRCPPFELPQPKPTQPAFRFEEGCDTGIPACGPGLSQAGMPVSPAGGAP